MQIIVWDTELPIPKTDSLIILWRTYNNDNNIGISIPEMLEKESYKYRNKYLSWIYSLGQVVIKGKSIINQLEIEKGFSYWWMTWVAHKPNYYESSYIINVIKCLVFEDIANEIGEITAIELTTTDTKLVEVFKSYSKKKAINFLFSVSAKSDKRDASYRSHFLRIPSSRIKSILFFGYNFVRNIFSFKRKDRKWKEDFNSSIIFFDIFGYLKPINSENKIFKSDYWTSLPKLLEKMKINSSWVHILAIRSRKLNAVTSSIQVAETVKEAQQAVNELNNNNNRQFHYLLDSSLSLLVMLKAGFNFLKLNYLFFKTSSIKNHFSPNYSSFNFWPFYKSNWKDGLIGFNAVKNCFHLQAYMNLLGKIPKQKIGFFIQENQPWEKALLYAWRLHKHGKIIGVPHTTIRFWDLRYFQDSRTYLHTNLNEPSFPDLIAINSPVSKDLLIEAGVNPKNIVEVEALRYLHLANTSVEKIAVQKQQLKIVVFGDNIPGSNEKVLKVIEEVCQKSEAIHLFYFRPHKDSRINIAVFNIPNLVVCTQNFAESIDSADLIISGNITSASVDAYCRKANVAIYLDGSDFNSSPLREMKEINYFSSAAELQKILDTIEFSKSDTKREYFHIDPELKKWQNIFREYNF